MSVIGDVYRRLSVNKWIEFFTRDERNWSNYLQRPDAFTPEAYEQLQKNQQQLLDSLCNDIKT